MTTAVEKTIEVQAPIHAVYDQWTQFEEFPTFMGGISEVRQLDDTRLHWVAEIAGVRREWDARITEQVPDSKVAWVATEGATNAGAVFFTELTPLTTQVRLHLEYAPEGVVEKAGDALGLVEKRATADLEKFKELIEAKGVPSGGWRGQVGVPTAGAPGVEQAAQTRGDSGKGGISAKAAVAGAAAAVVGVAAAAALKGRHSEDHEEPAPLPAPTPTHGSTPVTAAQPAPSLPPVEPVRSLKADTTPAPAATPRPAPTPPVTPPVDRTPDRGDDEEVVVKTEIVFEPRH